MAQNLIKNDPKIKAFLFECTELPPYSNQIRQVTGLPVYDALTTVETFCISKQPNHRIISSVWEGAQNYTEAPSKSVNLKENLVF